MYFSSLYFYVCDILTKFLFGIHRLMGRIERLLIRAVWYWSYPGVELVTSQTKSSDTAHSVNHGQAQSKEITTFRCTVFVFYLMYNLES